MQVVLVTPVKLFPTRSTDQMVVPLALLAVAQHGPAIPELLATAAAGVHRGHRLKVQSSRDAEQVCKTTNTRCTYSTHPAEGH